VKLLRILPLGWFEVFRNTLILGFTRDTALVATAEIEHRKERLARLTVPPVSLAARFVPHILQVFGLIVGLGIVRAIVTGISKIARKRPDKTGQFCAAAHMVCADCRLIHSRYDTAPDGSTDARRSESVGITNTIARQLIDIGRNRKLVAEATDMRADILAGQPQNIRPYYPISRGPDNITQYEYCGPGSYRLEKAAPTADRYTHNDLLRYPFFISLIFLNYTVTRMLFSYDINNLTKSKINSQGA